MELYGLISILGYMLLMAFFALRGAKKTANMEDYAVGSVAFSPVAVGLSLAASITSAATFIINPGFVAYYGISGVISMAFALPLGALCSLVVLTKKFRKKGVSMKSLTIAQWIGKRYESKSFALFFAFLSLLLITFVVLICVGLTKVIASTLQWNELYVLVGIVAFVFTYVMFGGANSMVYTNMIQASLMIIVAVVLLLSGYEYFLDSEGVVGRLKAIDPLLAAPLNPQSPLFRDYFEIIFCQFIVGVAVVCQPHIITKSLLLKKDEDVNTYLLTGVITEILFFSVVIVGLYARIHFPDLTLDGVAIALDSVMPTYVVTVLPIGLGLLVILGLISAGLSTLEGLIQSISTTITNDILSNLLFKHKEVKSEWKIRTNRVVIICLALISILFSYDQLISPNLSVGIFAQNGVYAYFSAAFIPVLCGLFLTHIRTLVVVVSSLTALFVHFGIYYGGITPYMEGAVRNPGIAAALAIISASLMASVLHLSLGGKSHKVSSTTEEDHVVSI
ncbi:sodium:solute symporter family transporter [Sediminitomix flava]|uniref:Sodium/pantothenate symporter n=1 Tax=Sediminitomix flava TaxID=379075 RepID=A0A316A4P9_SEDFL|nr:sodium:solute symporter [Sediminitomix flava]PWJ44737.1 sodium/pantothenate symporter [Sediminitomix flava]